MRICEKLEQLSAFDYTIGMRDTDLIQAEIMTVARTDKGTAVLVRPIAAEKAVPIFIGQLEAHSILIGIGKVPMPRPLTHDLMIGIMEKSKMTLERVEITDLREGTFYAHLVFKHGVRHIDMDSRPSDALALVARLNVPLFLSKHIIDEAGIPIDMISEETANGEAGAEMSQEELDAALVDIIDEDSIDNAAKADDSSFVRIKLQHQLEKAVENEDYEEAARLRDELMKLG